MNARNQKRLKAGPVMKKVLLLLEAGVALGLTASPHRQFKVIRTLAREWDAINKRALREAIRNLCVSKLVGHATNPDGTVSLHLTEGGKTKVLQYDFDRIKLKKPTHWDKFWRLVIFDIPEHKKQARDALAERLKHLGFYPVQKSVFIHPYPCQDEIEFLVELFGLRPHVRLFLVKETDIDIELKEHFQLL